MFSADGFGNLKFLDYLLAPAMRLGIKRCLVKDADLNVTLRLLEPSRPPITVALWLRQSQEAGRLDHSSVPRQLCSILVNPAPPLATLQYGDRLIVVVERCSTSKHPVSDRIIFNSLPTDRPTFVVTINPDRLTRRSDEVQSLVNRFKATQGAWFSLGVRSDKGTTAWQDVGEDIDAVTEQVTLGMLPFLYFVVSTNTH